MDHCRTLSLKVVVIASLSFILASGALMAQEYADTKINEYYWGTPLIKVIKDLKFKYHIPIVYDSAMVSGYKLDYLFDNTNAKMALEIIFRDNKDLSYMIDSNNLVQVIPRELAKGNMITGSNLKYQTKPQRFNLTVTGVIKDKLSGEPLPFASVLIRENSAGTSSNVDGYFTLQHVPSDTSAFIVFYLGYYRQTFHLTPKSDLTKLVVYLDPMPTELKAVEVKGEREELMRASEGGNMIKMAPAKIAELPSLGEKDIFRTFQLMPGIGGCNESSSGLYVRGGTPDQNLILYDGFTVYHQEHLFGMFSAFNPNAVKEVQLYKGGFESKYGGRLSSVMEIIGKTGNEEKFNAGVDAGFLGINGYMEIPLNHKGSVFVAGRRSYKTFLYEKLFDSFSQTSETSKPKVTVPDMGSGPPGMRQMEEEQSPTSYFYDLNFKATYPITRKDILSYSYFSGQDDYDNSRDLSRERGGISMEGDVTDLTTWGNWGTSLKWSRKWSEKTYTNNLISYSNYKSSKDRSSSRTFVNEDDETETFNSGTVEDNNLKDLCFKTDNELKTGRHNQLEFGAQVNYYNIKYNFIQNDTVTVLDMNNSGSLAALYIQNRWKPLDKFMFLPGIRMSYYDNTGKLYFEPRFQASYNLTEQLKIKGSTGVFYQFANRIIREDIASGSRDIWVLSNGDNIPVSKAIHVIGGACYENRNYLIDAEAYYKKLTGLTEYTLRFTQQFGPDQTVDYSSLFYNGEGYTRGFDVLFQKKYGKYSGWIGYTLSETRYHFPVYGNGYFSATQDVTNEVKIVNTYKYKKWTFSATWIFGTGMAYTRPLGGYVLTLPDSTTVDVIIPGSKNAARLPDYHRLDVSCKYDFRMGEFGKGSLSFSVFNLYNRKNVWYKEFEVDETGLTETNMTLLGITPNISLSVQIR